MLQLRGLWGCGGWPGNRYVDSGGLPSVLEVHERVAVCSVQRGQPPVSFFVTLYKCHPRRIQKFFFLMRCLLIFECWQPCPPQSHACWLASELEGRADECQRPPGDTRLPEGQLRRVEVTVQMVTYRDGHGDGLGSRGGRSRCQESASRRC